MKTFFSHAINKISEPSWHIVPIMATFIVVVVVILAIFAAWPVFSLIMALAVLGMYWIGMYEDYKASKEKQDE